MTKHVCDQAPDPILMKTFSETISAGDTLAEAAHRVQADHDGIHRLRLALAKWYTVRADEFGRKPTTKSEVGDGEKVS